MKRMVWLSFSPKPIDRNDCAPVEVVTSTTTATAKQLIVLIKVLFSLYLSPTGTFSTRIGTATDAPTPPTASASEKGAFGFPATIIWQERSSPPVDSDCMRVVGHGRPSTSKTCASRSA